MNRHDAGAAVVMLAPYADRLSIASAEADGLPLDAGPIAVMLFLPGGGTRLFAHLGEVVAWANDEKRRRAETAGIASFIASENRPGGGSAGGTPPL